MALKSDGSVVVWGAMAHAPASLKAGFAIDAGAVFSLALEAYGPLSFTSQPQSQTTNAGSSVIFSATPKGGGPELVQWLFDGNVIANATNLALVLTNVQAANAGNYSVVVSNLYGPVTSDSGSLTVTPVGPTITRQPRSWNVPAGFDVSLRADAVGSEPFAYQWRINGTDLPGETNATLRLPSVQLTNAGTYSVLVGNAVDSVASSNAVVSVSPRGLGLQVVPVAGAVDMVHDPARDILGHRPDQWQLDSALSCRLESLSRAVLSGRQPVGHRPVLRWQHPGCGGSFGEPRPRFTPWMRGRAPTG